MKTRTLVSSGAAERPFVLSPRAYAPREALHEIAGREGVSLRTVGWLLLFEQGEFGWVALRFGDRCVRWSSADIKVAD